MPGRVYEGDLTVPAGTPASAPVSSVINMPVGEIARVTLVVPDGHSGLTGLQMQLAGTSIVPYGPGTWITANGYQDSWDIDQPVNPGQFALVGYNTDAFQHTFYVRILWQPPAAAQGVSATLAAPDTGQVDLSALGADTGTDTGSGADTGTPGDVTGSLCYDISGNTVDCSDPNAVTGPVTGTPTGTPTGTGGAPGACYDISGNVVDCSDPSAVTGPVTPPPILTSPLPPPVAPPPPPVVPPPPIITPPKPPGVTPPGGGGHPPPPPKPKQHLPYRQIADGKSSLDDIAHWRHTTAAHIIEVTRGYKGMTRAGLAAFDHYVKDGTGKKMHKGLEYYTTNP